MVEGGRMKRRERYKRVLGILIAILCMEISALISIAEPDFQSYDDAQSAYYKYAEGFYTPEYREAQKKCTPYKVGTITFFLMGGTSVIIALSGRRRTGD